MFTMVLCDEDTSSTIKAVCFEDALVEKFEATKTYILRLFKLKKGMGAGSSIEVSIDGSTEINEAPTQFKIEKMSFKISQIVRHETENVRFLHLKAKVIGIDDIVTVGKYPDHKEKREVLLADETGHIIMVLWRERAKNVNFEKDDVVDIQNAVASSFNNKVNITTSSETTISKLSESLTVCAPNEVYIRPSAVTSVETGVLAIREFKCMVRCINCKKDIDFGGLDVDGCSSDFLVTCPTCSTTFLGEAARIINDCQLLLSSNKQWFGASTGVS
jgi:hypothetical protein